MKLSIDRSRFYKLLTTVNVAVGQKSPTPAFLNFKLEMTNAGLKVLGSDNDLTIQSTLPIIENDKATTTLASVIDSSDFLWTNEDIYRYESNEIVYKKFKAEEDIVALKPEIKTNLS